VTVGHCREATIIVLPRPVISADESICIPFAAKQMLQDWQMRMASDVAQLPWWRNWCVAAQATSPL